MQLEHLHHILAVYQHKSISKAAKEFKISQPALSLSIHNFEALFGIKIFRRTNTGVTVTRQGEEIAALAQDVLNDLESLKSIGKSINFIKKKIHLAISSLIPNHIMASLVYEFHQNYPNIEINIQKSAPMKIIDQINDHKASVGITGWLNSQDETMWQILESKNIAYEPIYSNQLSLYCGGEHPLADYSQISLMDAKSYPLVDCAGISETYLRMIGYQWEAQITRINSTENLKNFLSNNVSIAIAPTFLSQDDLHLNKQPLRKIPIIDNASYLNTKSYLIYSLEHDPSIIETRLIELIKQLYAY